ncbi:hypothetical protein A3742_13080 [Oleiphilus sp. HI0071]|jgi:hypothetical protein|uniref:DUF1329 domain-containing protein n=1 Tax=unclassified Oleiphilus TaxID=2631174 RepID=UPI0007C26D79|nr:MULTISPECIES: DUF1329 domain-containing protein [unclassified Oleiphilus]KZY62002.1 hypothetical protein A3737_20910 [Oleiphilus sp. HI0065]KZY80252.1 hypothetical protein A3742_13080 [Oleiphilus sp. HI0071]KZY93396.1 hypothetical protein A3744_01645 [Oleiphilus sp. HI0073]KZZ52428.1 hypothetical protein A3758_10540 [Oleiphilus sp. HI0118]KZZ53828.1 hypothetical protein A3760_17295 [Oleiphilus sp. HI0122]KZZ81536.1 hypothetical protein A3767_07905 [Oleiphilus sp. HI0133]
MKITRTLYAAGLLSAAIASSSAFAKVPAAEAGKLGGELTPVGAEKAGNADGSIPAWDGGLTSGGDALAAEQPSFVISKANVAEYADKLSEGQKAMLNAYDTYTMPVYASKRSATYSDELAAFAKENAVNAELIKDGNALSNVKGVVPFPIPQSALEVVWNHILRFRGGSFERNSVQVTPTSGGAYQPVKFFEEFSERYALTDFANNEDENVMFYFKQVVTAPARLAGNVLLVHETIDQVAEPRRAWIYNAGQRRVRRAPQVAYDGPGTASDGLRTSDNFDMFNGAPDRYNWELKGKKEMYIPYNSFKFDDKSLKYSDLVKPGHLNSEYARYELHRVWVVEGTLKSGERHIYSKRTFYIDEDTWGIVVADHYDGRGELWRHAEAHNKLYPEVGAILTTIESAHDLLSGRYIANGMVNEEPSRYNFEKDFSGKDFTPAALRRSGKR